MSLTYAKQPISREYGSQPLWTFVPFIRWGTAQTYKYRAIQRANVFKFKTPHKFVFFFTKNVHFFYTFKNIYPLYSFVSFEEKKINKVVGSFWI